MPINTKDVYIEIGTGVKENNELKNVLRLPAPNSLPSSNEFLVEGGRNATGTLSIQQIGRSQYTTKISWANLPSEKWWEINRWFDTYGYVFYMKYFSHTDGMVKIHKFYRGNVDQGEPSSRIVRKKGYNVPVSYKSCGFSIIDIGAKDVIIVEKMAVN